MSGNLHYMKSNGNPLGEWIRSALADLGRNQIWLANKVGVQPPQISRIIKGSSETTPDLLGAIADALGRPRVQAYRAAGYLEPQSQDDELESIMHEVKKMHKDDQAELLAYIRMKNNLRKKK